MTDAMGGKRTFRVVVLAGVLLAMGAARADEKPAPVDEARVARTVAAIREAVTSGLPLAGSWNTRTATPSWQIKTLLAGEGHVILPWFREARPGAEYNDRQKEYYETALRFAARHKLPIAFRATQWENELLNFANLPPEKNPCLVSPAGKVSKVISPFGPPELWQQVGHDFFDKNAVLKKLQEIYPDPPLVLFFSNNEPKTARKVSTATSGRLTRMLAADPKLASDPKAVSRLVNEGWQKRYQRMLKGLREALVSESWRANAVFIPYNMFNNTYSQGAGVVDWWYPNAWGGTSTRCYTAPYDANRDWRVNGPQGQAGNVRWSVEKVRTRYPAFFNELSIWYNSDRLISQLERRFKQPYPDERFRGLVQYVLWSIKPQSVRQFRGSSTPLDRYDRAFHILANCIDRVHRQPVLKRFWLEGTLVQNEDAATFARFAGPGRWCVLHADVNRDVTWRDASSAVPVFTLATVTGEAGGREWLLYAHAPLKAHTGVTITIPGYGPAKVDVPVGGAFYTLQEGKADAKRLKVSPGEHNLPPVAHGDRFGVAAGEQLQTTPYQYIGIPGVLKNDYEGDGDPMTAVQVDAPAHGKLAFRKDGTFLYVPEAGFAGIDTFTYKVADGALESAPAAVTILVTKLDKVIDNADTGFTSAAHWRSSNSDQACGGDFRFFPAANVPAGNSTATWTFTGLKSGRYTVEATWPLFSFDRPEKVRYSLLDGQTPRAVATVNQNAAPAGAKADSVTWQKLGQVQVASGTLKVVLDNGAKGRWVVADAVRVTPAGGGVSTVIDDGDEGYANVGRWMPSANGLRGGSEYMRGQKTSDPKTLCTAEWTFEGLAPGRYELYATWTASTSRTSVRYSAFAGGPKPVRSFGVNQADAPRSLFAGGAWWHSLGVVDVAGDTVKVRLTNQGGKQNIVADAVAIAARPKAPPPNPPKPAR